MQMDRDRAKKNKAANGGRDSFSFGSRAINMSNLAAGATGNGQRRIHGSTMEAAGWDRGRRHRAKRSADARPTDTEQLPVPK